MPSEEEERQIEMKDLVVAARHRLVEPEGHREAGAELQLVAQLDVEAGTETEREVVARVVGRIGLNVGGRADPGLVPEVETRGQEREEEVAGVKARREILV